MTYPLVPIEREGLVSMDPDDADRLRAPRGFEILDTAPEGAFDDLVRGDIQLRRAKGTIAHLEEVGCSDLLEEPAVQAVVLHRRDRAG